MAGVLEVEAALLYCGLRIADCGLRRRRGFGHVGNGSLLIALAIVGGSSLVGAFGGRTRNEGGFQAADGEAVAGFGKGQVEVGDDFDVGADRVGVAADERA